MTKECLNFLSERYTFTVKCVLIFKTSKETFQIIVKRLSITDCWKRSYVKKNTETNWVKVEHMYQIYVIIVGIIW